MTILACFEILTLFKRFTIKFSSNVKKRKKIVKIFQFEAIAKDNSLVYFGNKMYIEGNLAQWDQIEEQCSDI